MNAPRDAALQAATADRRLQRWHMRLAQHRPSVTPRIVLHLLVGALTLVSAQALFKPPGKLWEQVMSTSVAFAEQPQAAGLSTIVTPALAAGEPRVTDLSSTIGQVGAPSMPVWRGFAGAEANRRATPDRSRPPVGELRAGAPVEVVDWVTGEEVESHNDTWARLSDSTYVFSTSLRRSPLGAAPATPASAPAQGRWVDVNLTEQVATAYEGGTAVRSALISTGRPGWDTPTGVFPVLRRTEKDTMDGATLIGQGPDGKGASYKVENVRYVQYFTPDGAAIHENYWRRPATFGMPGSHGCIGMASADAAWFWEFATVGTPLVIHE